MYKRKVFLKNNNLQTRGYISCLWAKRMRWGLICLVIIILQSQKLDIFEKKNTKKQKYGTTHYYYMSEGDTFSRTQGATISKKKSNRWHTNFLCYNFKKNQIPRWHTNFLLLSYWSILLMASTTSPWFIDIETDEKRSQFCNAFQPMILS